MADQGTEGLLSPYLRNKRIHAVIPHLQGRVLDFGCGGGLLAKLIDCKKYLGVEIDEISLQKAKSMFPTHQFSRSLPNAGEKFDTVVSLAVIEHVEDPASFLRELSEFLNNGKLVITTPHPSVDWVHGLGATIGLFSKHANEEHGDLLDQTRLEMIGAQAGLKLDSYSKFLFGANQVAVYSKVVV
jgi:2-polyprenyl-3-methyl-5-hydroxy-6-metoxy-1,4-benzoquinol methylase